MASSKTKNNMLKTILLNSENTCNEGFVFLVEVFQFFTFYEKEAKPNICKFKKGLAMPFNVQNLRNYWKICLQFCKLTFLGVSEQAICKFT